MCSKRVLVLQVDVDIVMEDSWQSPAPTDTRILFQIGERTLHRHIIDALPCKTVANLLNRLNHVFFFSFVFGHYFVDLKQMRILVTPAFKLFFH